MCDYSLQHVRSRPAKVGDKLVTHNFGTGTRGLLPQDGPLAVCLIPGTELAFASPVTLAASLLLGWKAEIISHATAIFGQVNKNEPRSTMMHSNSRMGGLFS